MLAALFGAVLGGLFTLRGQTKAEEAQAARDEVARQNQLADARRADVQDDARALFRAFVDLESEVRSAPDGQRSNGTIKWRAVWESIWTRERSTEFRILAELIPEPQAREQIKTVVRYLGLAPDYSREGWEASSRFPLRHIVSGLVQEGVRAMSAYLRHDTYNFERDQLWSALEDSERKMRDFLSETDA